MAVSVATSGFGTLLAAGDGGVGSGTAASKTIGSSNQALTVTSRFANAAGNSKTFGIIVAAGTVAYSQVITQTSVLINSATTSGTATTTVAAALGLLFADATFATYFTASTTGNGSGVLVAGASGALSGGVDGTEIFTPIAEIHSITGPNFQVAFADVTHMQSPSSVREFLPTLIDPGQLSFVCAFLPDNATHTAMRVDMLARTKRNFTMTMTDPAPNAVWAFSGYYSQLDLQTPLDGPALVTLGIKLTSTITVS